MCCALLVVVRYWKHSRAYLYEKYDIPRNEIENIKLSDLPHMRINLSLLWKK